MASGVVALYGCAVHPVDPGRGGSAARPGFVVAALGGTGDAITGDMVTEIARRTGFGLVLAATGSGVEARPADETYERRVREAARGPLRFFAEIHGRHRRECAGQIEIATVGVDPELALRLRALAELIRDAHLRTNREIQRLDVLVEDVDAAAGRAGILRLAERALHIELPTCTRRDWQETYTAILADFLMQAAAVPAGR